MMMIMGNLTNTGNIYLTKRKKNTIFGVLRKSKNIYVPFDIQLQPVDHMDARILPYGSEG